MSREAVGIAGTIVIALLWFLLDLRGEEWLPEVWRDFRRKRREVRTWETELT